MAPDIAIIVPVYDEQDNVLPMAREVSEAMKNVGRSYELVFVDDASRDSTWQKIEEARRQLPNVRGLRHAVNSGQSAALWTGIRATTSPIIATLDGDLQNDPADIPNMLPALEKADFICGVRTKRRDSFACPAINYYIEIVANSVFQADTLAVMIASRLLPEPTH